MIAVSLWMELNCVQSLEVCGDGFESYYFLFVKNMVWSKACVFGKGLRVFMQAAVCSSFFASKIKI